MPSTQQLRNSAVGTRTARRCPWEPSGRYACNAHTIRVWGTAGSVRLGGARQDLSACPERPTDPCARLPPRCSHRSRKARPPSPGWCGRTCGNHHDSACASSERIMTPHMPAQTWVYVCGDGHYACASSEARWNVRCGYSDLCVRV